MRKLWKIAGSDERGWQESYVPQKPAFKGTTGGLKGNISHSTLKSSSFTPLLCVSLNLYMLWRARLTLS